jgi:hypothetical protein
MIGVERADDWWQWRPSVSARAAGPAGAARSVAGIISGTLPECGAGAANGGAERQREDPGSFTTFVLSFHGDFWGDESPFVSMNIASHC